MAKLELAAVPERTYQMLERQARASGKSIDQEALNCIEESLRRRADTAALLDELRQFRASLGSVYVTEAFLQQAKREGRE